MTVWSNLVTRDSRDSSFSAGYCGSFGIGTANCRFKVGQILFDFILGN